MQGKLSVALSVSRLEKWINRRIDKKKPYTTWERTGTRGGMPATQGVQAATGRSCLTKHHRELPAELSTALLRDFGRIIWNPFQRILRQIPRNS